MKTILQLILGSLAASTLLVPPDSSAEAPQSREAISKAQRTGSVEQKLSGLMTIWSEAKHYRLKPVGWSCD